MKRSLLTGALFAAAFGFAAPAHAQAYPPHPLSFDVRPAMPESMPTLSPSSSMLPDDVSGTAKHTITATPDCGPASPQRGIPSMVTGTCP